MSALLGGAVERSRIFYGLGRLELHLPQSHSLKDKRSIVGSLKNRLAERLRVVVIETGPQDLWQRAVLGVALLAKEESQARQSLSSVARSVEEDYRVVLLSFETKVGSMDDEEPAEEGR